MLVRGVLVRIGSRAEVRRAQLIYGRQRRHLEGVQAVQQVCIKELDANPAVNGRRVGKRSVEALLKHCPCWRHQPREEQVGVEGGARVTVGGVVEFGAGAILPELAQACNAVRPKAQVGAARLPDAAHDEAALLA